MLVLVEGSYQQKSNVSFSKDDSLALNFKGLVQNLRLVLSAPSLDLKPFLGNGTIKTSSVLVKLESDVLMKISSLVFIDSGFSADPNGLALYGLDLDVTESQFLAVSSAAPESIFYLPIPQSVTRLTTRSKLSFSHCSASLYLNDSTGRSPYFVHAQGFVDSIGFFHSTIDGAATLVYFTNLGYGHLITVSQTSILGLRNSLVYVTRWAQSSSVRFDRSILAANDAPSSSAPSQGPTTSIPSPISDPRDGFMTVYVWNSEIHGMNQSSPSYKLPKVSSSGVAFTGLYSNFSGISINCGGYRTPLKLPSYGSSKIEHSFFHNCGTCLDAVTQSVTNVSFTYLTHDTEHIFTSFSDIPRGCELKSTSFIDLDEQSVLKNVSRLYFLGTLNMIESSKVRTNSLWVQAMSTLEIAEISLTGSVTLHSGSEFKSLDHMQWTFEAPLSFKYGSTDGGSAVVDLSDLKMLEIRPNADYIRQAGISSIFTNDIGVMVVYQAYQHAFSRVHINWNATTFGSPASNTLYSIGNFTLTDYDSRIYSNREALPMSSADVFSFDGVLQTFNDSLRIYREYFTLNSTLPGSAPSSAPFALNPVAPPKIGPTPTSPTPPALGCSSSAPIVEGPSTESWSCLNGVWVYDGNLNVSKSSSFKISAGSRYVKVLGNLNMEEDSEVLFMDIATELIVDGCTDSLKKITFDPASIPHDRWTQTVLVQSGCRDERRVKSFDVKIDIISPRGCTKYNVARVPGTGPYVLEVQFGIRKAQCHVIYGVIGGFSAAVIIAGIIIVFACVKRRRTQSEDYAYIPLIQ